MVLLDAFVFDDNPSIRSDAFVARVPNGVVSASALVEGLFECMGMPGYFGFNWNALSDCLRDMHWMKNHNVVMVHGDVPELSPRELREYLEVLHRCVGSWGPEEGHSLTVVFPGGARPHIEKLISEPG